MRKQKSSIKSRQVLSSLFISCSLLILVALFAFKDNLTGYSSKLMLAQADPQTINTEARRIDSAYNYNKNGLPYQFTFLEFGAKGCSACIPNDSGRDISMCMIYRYLRKRLTIRQIYS